VNLVVPGHEKHRRDVKPFLGIIPSRGKCKGRCGRALGKLRKTACQSGNRLVSGWKAGTAGFMTTVSYGSMAWPVLFGVMGKSETVQASRNWNSKRRQVFPESGYLGLPLNLIPIENPTYAVRGNKHYKLMPSYEELY